MSETERVKPALTPEEWVEFRSYYEPETVYASGGYHALAAWALHGQPFGFTREDVENHRREAEVARRSDYDDHRAMAAWHDSMADRIEALLPPEVDRIIPG